MAQIDPNIILSAVQAQRSGSTPFTKLQDIMQFQGLIEQQKQREAQAQKQRTISDLIRQNVQQTPEGIQLNQPQFIQQLSEVDPEMALTQQAQMESQEAKLNAQKAQERKLIAEADTETLNRAKKRSELIGSAAGAVLNAPQEQQQAVLDNQLDMLIDQGVVSQEMLQAGNIPLTINPKNLEILRGIQQSALSSKEQLDFELAQRETPKKETPKEKSAREQKELQLQLPDIVSVKKGKRVSPKTVERTQNTISFGSEMIDGIGRAKRAINKLNRLGIIGKSFNPGDPQMAAVQSELRALQLLEKGPEGAQLGVLAGPDLDILDAVTGSPENMSLILKGPGATIEKLKRLEQRLVNKTNSKLKSWNLNTITGTQLKEFTSETPDFSSVQEAVKSSIPFEMMTINGIKPIPFESEELAEKAKLDKNTPVIVNGRLGVIE